MARIRDLLLVPALGAGLAVGLAAYRLLAGPAALGDVLLGPPAAAIGPGLLVGAAGVGWRGRSRLGAALGGAAGSGLGGLHAGLAASLGAAQLPVLAAGGLASGIAVYLGYEAILPPDPPDGEA